MTDGPCQGFRGGAVGDVLWVDGEPSECHDWEFKQSYYITSKTWFTSPQAAPEPFSLLDQLGSLANSHFSQPISSRPLIHVACSSRAEFSFQWINSLSRPLGLSPVQFPRRFFHLVLGHASVTIFIILKMERKCFCWSCPILFSLYWTPKCAVWAQADGWGRKATDLIFPFNFQIFPCLPGFVFSSNSASKYVPFSSLLR